MTGFIEHGILFRGDMVRAIRAGTKTQTRRTVTPRNTWLNGDPWAGWAKEATWDWGRARVDGGPSPAGNPGPYLHLPFVSHPDTDVASWAAGTSHRVYPRVQPEDRLWVRETWKSVGYSGRNLDTANPIHEVFLDYAAGGGRSVQLGHREDGGSLRADGQVAWRPSIFMPRWASRITLPVVRVRFERVQEISEADARAEGVGFDGQWFLGADHPVKGTPKVFPSAAQAFASLWDSINAERAPWATNPWVLVYEWGLFHG